MPPEAVPYILMVQDWLEKYPDWLNNPPPQKPLTIRQALWITRLYGIITLREIEKAQEVHRKAKEQSEEEIAKYKRNRASFLWAWAEAYATLEVICRLSGVPVETSKLDKAMRQAGTPVTVGKTILIFYPDNRFEIIGTMDEKLLQQLQEMHKKGEI
jgi:hypothetical protein